MGKAPPQVGLVRRTLAKWMVRALNLQGISYYNGGYGPWYGAILESYAGAWQQNVIAAAPSSLLSFSPIWSCVTGIASDISKMRMMLSRNDDGIWTEITANSPWLPLLSNPNHYQDSVKFFESWMLSKLLYGNTYVLKRRKDLRGLVTDLHVLHPNSVKPLVATNGDVYYRVSRDDLSGVAEVDHVEDAEEFTIPARHIIHDRFNTLWHPLIGVSPLYACGTSGTLGNAIQTNANKFFANRSLPGGMLSAPGAISDETAARLKATFESSFGGDNLGRMAVFGDGLDFKPFSIDAQKAQQVEQLDWTVLDASRAFHYPAWLLNGKDPPYEKPDMALTLYYSTCLHKHVSDIEACLKDGLELPLGQRTDFDIDSLMRMDTNALFESNNKAKEWMKLNEQRRRANLPPDPSGDTIWKQDQDHSITALDNRDKVLPPWNGQPVPEKSSPAPAPAPTPAPEPARTAEPSREELLIMRDALAFRIRKRVAAA